MSREETLATRYGEMLDLIACMSIYNGRATQKKKKMTMETILFDMR